MNFDDLAKLTDQLLRELPTTPVATDAVPDGRTIAGLWSGLMTVHHSRASVMFENPVVRVAIVRHKRTATILNEQIDAAASVGRQDMRLARNTWEAVLQLVATRRDSHRHVAVLALRQMLATDSDLVVDVQPEQQRYAVDSLGIMCPATVPVSALQALRAFGECMQGASMPWPFVGLPDMRESFPYTSEDDRDAESVPDEVAELATVSSSEEVQPQLSLADIRAGLEAVIIGQDEAVRAFTACAFRHQRGISQGAVLVTGKTGVGKSSLALAWGKLSDRPVVIVDCTTLVPEGIRGGTISDAVIAVWHAAGKDLAKASRGVLIFDEYDKMNRQYALSLRNSLLKMMDGAPWKSFDADRFDRNAKLDSFPTRDLMIVLAGSYSEERDTHDRKIGFEPSGPTNGISQAMDLETLIPLEDLRGRIGTHIDMRALDRDALTRILLSEQGPLSGLRMLFLEYSIRPTPDLIDRIVQAALNSGLGARGLVPPVRDLELRLLFNQPTCPGEYEGIIFGWKIRGIDTRRPSNAMDVHSAQGETVHHKSKTA